MSSRKPLLIVLSIVMVLLESCGGKSDHSQFSLSEFDWDNSTNLSNHDYWDFDPDYSPDGTLIAFHSNRSPSPGNRGQIYLMNSDGSNPRALTHTEGTNYGAAWSPDGSMIAFTTERDGNPEAYVMNADGSHQTNLSNNPDAYDAGPEWSPDGKYIAFFSGTKKPANDDYIASGSPYRYWNADIFILNMETGKRTRITDSNDDDTYPVWSNDGKRLAFTSSRDGNNEIYVMNVDGTNQRRITNNDRQDNAALWLPGDNALSFNNSEEIDGEDHMNIYVADLDSGEIARVTDRPGTVYFNGNVSPDGQKLVYAAFTKDESAFRGERADIYLIEKK